MDEERIKEIALSIYVVLALILFIIQGRQLHIATITAILLFFAVTLVFPLLGLLIAIPTVIVVYFNHHGELLTKWKDFAASSKTIDKMTGGF